MNAGTLNTLFMQYIMQTEARNEEMQTKISALQASVATMRGEIEKLHFENFELKDEVLKCRNQVTDVGLDLSKLKQDVGAVQWLQQETPKTKRGGFSMWEHSIPSPEELLETSPDAFFNDGEGGAVEEMKVGGGADENMGLAAEILSDYCEDAGCEPSAEISKTLDRMPCSSCSKDVAVSRFFKGSQRTVLCKKCRKKYRPRLLPELKL